MDMSLDDIIMRKKQFNVRKKGQVVRKGVQKGVSPKGKIGAAKNGNIGDARLKILQNQRNKYKDARDKLVAINKLKGDARQKIEKLRVEKLHHKPMVGAGRISVQRSLDGRLRLTTKKKALIPVSPSKMVAPTRRPPEFMRMHQPVYKEPAPRLEAISNYGPVSSYPAVIRRTIDNRLLDYGYPVSESVRPSHLWQESPSVMYRSANEEIKPIPAIITRRSEMTSWPRSYQEPPTVVTQRSDPYAASRLRMDQETESLRMSSVHSRLDRPSSYQRPQLPPTPSEEDGFRIIVSNLHPTVTSVDIKELFEDVGELLAWRVVRAGTAEVVYKRHDQAVKAVEVYHNRLLDGLPMKCMLVNSLKASNGRQQKILQAAGGIKATVRPDLDAVRDALFGYQALCPKEPVFKRHNF